MVNDVTRVNVRGAQDNSYAVDLGSRFDVHKVEDPVLYVYLEDVVTSLRVSSVLAAGEDGEDVVSVRVISLETYDGRYCRGGTRGVWCFLRSFSFVALVVVASPAGIS